MEIGKIVKSNSHTDYVCQIYGLGEIEHSPGVSDYAFGTFVRAALATHPESWLVGLIYDTILLNPDFGRLGPRLSPPSDLAVFSPDYLNEKVTLVGIIAIGMISSGGLVTQGIPPYSATMDALVETMTSRQICDFHAGNPSFRLAYLPYLLNKNTPDARYLVQRVLCDLRQIFTTPEQVRILELISDDVNWNNQITPLGGLS